jgi:uncharacterized protein (DUF169 family)
MSNATIAERLTKLLALETSPVALTFTDSPPESVPGPDRAVPSACSFWRLAESGVFYAPADAHYNCAIGTMVMGFPLPDQVQQTLGNLMNSMCGCDYFGADETDKVPVIQPSANGILYGPLADLPVPPGVVLLWLSPRQAMLFNEAAGTASWATGAPLTTGRPACAALPAALSHDSAAISLGCAGMRTFTDVSDDKLLAAVPGDRIGDFVDDLDRVSTANDTMLTYYHERKASLAANA